MKNIRRGSLKLFLLVFSIICMSLFQPVFAETGTSGSDQIDSDYLQSVTDMIKDKYNGQTTNDQLIQGALQGIFGSMDPYTTFFTKEEAESFSNTLSGTYSGIGISMGLSGEYIIVANVMAGSPAQKAGLKQGDKITEVNDKNIVGASIDEVISLIMGETGTKVKLGIIRSGQKGTLGFEITRAEISINPVTYEVKKGIGYIKLDIFSSNAGSCMSQALKELDKQKVTKIILDLRGNPGGEVGQAVEVARNFVPSGLITKLDYKSESYTDEPYYSFLDTPKYKLAVLVNSSSASASEILAGAIQDTQAGTLIGTKTFGKAKVQEVIPLLTPEASEKYEVITGKRIVDVYELYEDYGISPTEDDIIGYTKMTVAYYYTPKGRMIDGVGLIPDISVNDPSPVPDIDPTGMQKLSQTVKPGLNDGGSDVMNAEKILQVLGYSVDTPDMTLDSKTFNAIKKFQKDMKLYSYGVLDFTTQKALNAKLDDIIQKYDKQFAKAVELLSGT